MVPFILNRSGDDYFIPDAPRRYLHMVNRYQFTCGTLPLLCCLSFDDNHLHPNAPFLWFRHSESSCFSPCRDTLYGDDGDFCY